MPANGLRVNHYDFVALHSMWIIFLKGKCVLLRVEIINKSKFLPGTVEKKLFPVRISTCVSIYTCTKTHLPFRVKCHKIMIYPQPIGMASHIKSVCLSPRIL